MKCTFCSLTEFLLKKNVEYIGKIMYFIELKFIFRLIEIKFSKLFTNEQTEFLLVVFNKPFFIVFTAMT